MIIGEYIRKCHSQLIKSQHYESGIFEIMIIFLYYCAGSGSGSG